MTLRRVLALWTGLVVAGWLVLGFLAEEDAKDCRADADGFLDFCGDPGESFFGIGIAAAALWLFGAFTILIMGAVIRIAILEFRRARRSVPPA